MDKNKLIEALLSPAAGMDARLSALSALGRPDSENGGVWVNNHIHTTYSFSPYTPAGAVYFAAAAGLSTAGIMDHDSVGGLNEFIEAGKIIGMPVTVGFECRTSVVGTPLEGKRLNNPDQKSVAYVTLHGIPHQNIGLCESVLSPLREKRNLRNIKICQRINGLVPEILRIDFEKDVLPLSMFADGGSVTERHVLYALALKLAAAYPDRQACCNKIAELSGAPMSEKTMIKLLNAPAEFYTYDLLGVLKSGLISSVYVDADDELMHISDFVALAKKAGGISAYAYLGDVGESPTGDKKAQKFEDGYLDELFGCLGDFGFNAVTYMPSRNTEAQLERVMRLCRDNGFFQVSGEDINSPRQSFVCPAMQKFNHLYDATYALIGHEAKASQDASLGMFSDSTKAKMPLLSDRIKYYSQIGRKLY